MSEPLDLHAAAFQAVHRWWQAWVDRDFHVVEQMVSADYVEKSDMGRLRCGRLAEIVSHQTEGCAITDWELSDPVTRLFENVVVCSYAFRFSGRRGAEVVTYEGHATDVLSRRGDDWIFVSHEGVLDRGRRVS